MTVVKFQNEPIDTADILADDTTVWIVDAGLAVTGDPTLLDSWYDGARVGVIRTPWIVNLIAVCQDAHGGTVAFDFEGKLSIIKKAAIEYDNGEKIALVAGFAEPFSKASLNEWRRGERITDIADLPMLESLDLRRIRYFRHFFDVAVSGKKVRVCFNDFHKARRDEGTALGLVWTRTVEPVEFKNGDLSEVGFLSGPRTPEVEGWLRDSFGWDCQDVMVAS